jgi:uncharacterized protein YjiS (DUF1127 family)
MSCGSTICSPTISYSWPVPAFPFGRPGVFAIPRREHLRAAIDAVARARARRAGRLALMQLDDRLLADIAVTRAQAGREARKPFWQ